MPHEHSPKHALAAMIYTADTDPSPEMEKAVRAFQAKGVALAGAIQHSSGPCSMELELLPSGLRMAISQNLGSGSSGCRLDPAALAEAASIVRRAVDTSPALAVFNKFGAQEAAGSGMRDEMTAAVLAGIPLLTAVKQEQLQAWRDFTGGDAAELPCSAEAALAWWDAFSAG